MHVAAPRMATRPAHKNNISRVSVLNATRSSRRTVAAQSTAAAAPSPAAAAPVTPVAPAPAAAPAVGKVYAVPAPGRPLIAGFAAQNGDARKSSTYTSTMQAKMGTSLTYRHEDGMNYNFILPDLIVGSCLQTPADVDRLAAAGVTTVFCLQEDSDMAYFNLDIGAVTARCAERGDIEHVRFPIRDFDPFDLRKKLPKAVARLARSHRPNEGVAYIHCTAGTILRFFHSFLSIPIVPLINCSVGGWCWLCCVAAWLGFLDASAPFYHFLSFPQAFLSWTLVLRALLARPEPGTASALACIISTHFHQAAETFAMLYQSKHPSFALRAAGLGRAPAVALAYMNWLRGWQLDEAFGKLTGERRCSPRIEAIRAATADLLLNVSPLEVTISHARYTVRSCHPPALTLPRHLCNLRSTAWLFISPVLD